jgi:type II restriction enzyme
MCNNEWNYNKGEWSEAYVFIKLLGDGKVYGADENLNKIEEEYYPILKILKNEIEKQYIRKEKSEIIEISDLNGNIEKIINVNKFIELSKNTLIEIKKNKGTFQIPILENFFKEISISQFKSPSKNKPDLIMEIKDLKTDISKESSFSIKSELGSNPTILNASKATNFIFQIKGIEEYKVDEIMRITKKTDKKWLKLRIAKIKEIVNRKKYDLSFYQIESNQFSSNLKLIDSNLPFIISQILLFYYSNEKISDLKSLTEYLVSTNPLNLLDSEKDLFYKNNIIELIKSAAFGMMPNKKWNKEYDIDGGLLTVLKDGNVLLHHLFYNKQQLDEYLYRNTKLDTPSTTRYGIGELYKLPEDKLNYYFKLNLQIRIK